MKLENWMALAWFLYGLLTIVAVGGWVRGPWLYAAPLVMVALELWAQKRKRGRDD